MAEAGRGVMYGGVIPSTEEEARLQLAEQLEETARRFEQLGGLEDRGRGLFADERGRLWRREPGEPRSGRDPAVFAFRVGSDLKPIWYARPDGGPRTVQELERLEQRAAEASERRRSDAEMDRVQARASAEIVTLADVLPTDLPAVTLRKAVEDLYALGGVVKVRDGIVLVALPPAAKGRDRYTGKLRRGLDLARLAYLAEAELVATMRGKSGDVDPGKVPDRMLLPSGRLEP